MTAEQGWKLVAEMGWSKEADIDAMAKFWWTKLGKETMEALRRFVDARCSDLYSAVNKYEQKNGELFVGSDDGFSDLRYHVVGLGQKAFEEAMQDPRKLQERYLKHDYKESFAYVFHEPTRTVEQIETFSKLLAKNLAGSRKTASRTGAPA